MAKDKWIECGTAWANKNNPEGMNWTMKCPHCGGQWFAVAWPNKKQDGNQPAWRMNRPPKAKDDPAEPKPKEETTSDPF